jgi:hypothetical protein
MNMQLTNDFHRTECTIRPKPAGNGRVWVSNAVAARARRTLCGIEGCTCHGNLGELPSVEAIPDAKGEGWFITDGA